jgi:transketolase C-terminal domain/subunit
VLPIAAERDDLVGVTAAGPISAGLEGFAERFPERVFDIGVAAQQGVCSAGLAAGGMRPLLALHTADLGRAFDQILSDVALPRELSRKPMPRPPGRVREGRRRSQQVTPRFGPFVELGSLPCA